MHPSPPTIGRDATLEEVLDVLLSGRYCEVYVIDGGGRLLGVVPDYELLKARLSQTDGRQLVDTLMTRCCATTHPDVEIAAISAMFRECRYQRLAVVEDGILVGQIGRGDILRLLASSAAQPRCEAGEEHEDGSGVRALLGKNRLFSEAEPFRALRVNGSAEIRREQRETA